MMAWKWRGVCCKDGRHHPFSTAEGCPFSGKGSDRGTTLPCLVVSHSLITASHHFGVCIFIRNLPSVKRGEQQKGGGGDKAWDCWRHHF